jgi:phage-related protein
MSISWATFPACYLETIPRMAIDISYKNLYKWVVTSEGSKTRIKWEGKTKDEIKSWPDDVRQDMGLELHRLDNHEDPLDAKPLGKGITELRDQDKDFWYRLLYALHAGWIYVLHCFTKTTNQIPKRDLDLATERLSNVKRRNDPPYEEPEVAEEEESA